MTVFIYNNAMVCCLALALSCIIGMYYFSFKENKKIRAFSIIILGVFGLGSTYWLSSFWID